MKDEPGSMKNRAFLSCSAPTVTSLLPLEAKALLCQEFQWNRGWRRFNLARSVYCAFFKNGNNDIDENAFSFRCFKGCKRFIIKVQV